ncbi:PEPxxWA-CTERM sorting domain-containing protein [Sphingomonas sp. KR1UV-12]|uniref:PEPxxWA-CTERM sorting domain-containing protein n=1 Tax=Sphingomonas aurea TaxID=3063994 RepID=A0ABT9EMX1_9SPHN|nr:PEPxxWA-CTERM sorting domain-containing protein [Sphingomonas sp. KR1UV-12]MDP1028301.1 PEPxxWA-CTERM sorting domain-containing protein [Sphingomonas sp. KR1UV-12]
MKNAVLLGVIAAVACGVAVPAAAQTVGSASLVTVRGCGATATDAACDGLGPRQGITFRQYGGGVGVAGTNSYDPGNGNQSWSTVSFDPGSDLPTIRAYTRANDQSRVNINTFAFQSFVYNGTAPIEFSITGALHMVGSSASALGGALPDGAIFSQYVGIWDPSILNGLTTAQELNANLFYADCGTEGVLASGFSGGTLTGGNGIAATTTTTGCSPSGSLFLQPGQEVLVVAGLQLPVNRGGFADSSGTFTTRLGDDLSAETRADLTRNLESATDRGAVLAAVPEPASWMMMVLGFGTIGFVARARRRIGAAALV